MILKARSNYFTNDAGVELAPAGGGGSTVTPPAAVVPPIAAKFELPENWRDSLPEDLKNDPTVKSYNSIEALAKTLVQSQKILGSDKVLVPSKHATPEEIRSYYKKSGIPEEKDYKVEVSKDEQVDGKFLETFTKIAAKEMVHPTQAKAILSGSLAYLKQAQSEKEAATKLETETGLKALKEEWGAAYDEKVNKAHQAFLKFGDEGLKKVLDSGFGNNPNVIKAFSKIGDLISEGKIRGDADTTGAMTPAEAQLKANEILMNPEHPHNLGGHPNHKAALEEMTKLYEIIHYTKKD